MPSTDHARKLLIRAALTTGTTIATLIGAQNFAALDARRFQIPETPTADVSVTPSATISIDTVLPTQSSSETAVFEATVARSAPSLVILRQPGQVSGVTVSSSPSQTGAVRNPTQPPVSALTVSRPVGSIQPPVPVQIPAQVVQIPASGSVAAPEPSIVQQPIIQTSRSTR